MSAHEIHALSGAYAVDALDDLERARFEDHMAACAECRAEVAGLQDTTLLLAGLSDTAPAPELRAKILADIKTVRPLPPVLARITPRRPRRWANLVAAAAVLGVIGGGTAVWQNVHQSTPTPGISQADRVIEASDVQLSNASLGKNVSASLFRSKDVGSAVIVTRNMPAAPSGRVYELWLRDKTGTLQPAGLMTKGGDSKILLTGDAVDATGGGITVEPKGGSKTPTTSPIAVFDFKQST
ncbi:MAG TPA: anti-sigma factor [Marmoricola sp.]|jgi:anti-sigma-K factor RskA|nr:anti-sigma factor [Marmoricola sp.]